MTKPIEYHFPEEIQRRVAEIVEPFKRRDDWIRLQIPTMDVPRGAFLLTGRPGVGKTTLARQILRSISRLPANQIPVVRMGDCASEKLGQAESAIKAGFNLAFVKCKRDDKLTRTPVLFMDECDAIGWKRGMVDKHSMFMLSIVDTLLLEIDNFEDKGGCVGFATNYPDLLDPALLRRMNDIIEVHSPLGEDAMKVWRTLMPPQPFGFPITDQQANLGWTPNEIEHFIVSEARAAFLDKRNMKFTIPHQP